MDAERTGALEAVRRLGWMLGLAGFVALAATCSDAPTAPAGARHADVALAPSYSRESQAALASLASFQLSIDNVHLRLLRSSTTAPTVLDTIVPFPAGADSLVLQFSINLIAEREQLSALLQLRSGTQVLFEGTSTLDVRSGGAGTVAPPIPMGYVGPGATVKSLGITPRSLTLSTTATADFSVSPKDTAGNPVAGVLVSWERSDAALAAISGTGHLTPSGKRGTVFVIASTPNGVRDSAVVTLVPPPAKVVVVSGDGQSDTAGHALAQPLVVEVDAADGLPSAGIPVQFRTAGGGGTISPVTTTTDAQGRASASATLGRVVGANTFEASVAGLATVTFRATAKPGAPAAIAIVSGDAQTDSVGTALVQPLVVKVSDAFGNVVPGTTVAWARASGTGSLASATSTTDTAGLARNAYTLGRAPGAESVRASVGGAADASVAFTFRAATGSPATLTILSGDQQGAVVGTTLPVPLAVRVADRLGNAATGVPVGWSVQSGGGTLSAGVSTTDSTGRASVTYTLGTTPGTNAVVAAAGTLSARFTTVARTGAPAQITKLAGDGQTKPAGEPVDVAPSVRVADSFGNPVSGVTVTFTVTAGSGTVTGATPTTNASGAATLGSWTMGTSGGPQSLEARVGSVSTTFAATATGGAIAKLAIVSDTVGQLFQNGVAVTPTIRIQLRDARDNPVKRAGMTVRAAVAPATGSITAVPSAPTDTGGTASLTGLTIGASSGAYTLTFAVDSPAVQLAWNVHVAAGPAAQMTAAGGEGQAAFVGSALPQSLSVLVRDGSGNGVAGASVTWTVYHGAGTFGGAPSPTTSTTDATGHAAVAFTPTMAGADSVRATLGALQASFGAMGVPPGTDRTWVGGGSPYPGQWSNAANWIPNGVPAATERVFIPATSPANRPALGANTTLAGLIVAAGAQLNIVGYTLTITGNLDATGGMYGSGSVVLAGTGRVHGSILNAVSQGTIAVDGPLTIAGPLTIQNGTFDVGAQQVTVTGGLLVQSALVMRDPLGKLSVSGGANFTGWNEDGNLTAGVLEVGGNFEQHSADPNSFRTSGSFLTRFTGTADQTVAIYNYSGFGNSRFTQLEDAKTGGTLSFATYVAVAGDFTVSQPRAVSASTIDVAGQITTVAGSNLSAVGNLQVVGGGTNFPVVGGIPAQALTIVSGPTVALSADRAYAGPLYVDGVLDLAGHALALGSDLRVRGALVMTSPAGHLMVDGNVNFTGWSEDGNLTAGVMDVKGNFEQHSADPNSFRTSGSFLTRFTGAYDQTVAIYNYSGFGNSRFTHLENAKPAGTLTFATYVAVAGDFTVSQPRTVVAGTVDVAGQIAAVAGSDLSGVGNLQVVGGGTNFPVVAGVPAAALTIVSGPTVVLSADRSYGGPLYVNGVLDLAGHALTLGSDLRVGGALIMRNPAAKLVVGGNVNFTGWSEDGNLTAGVMEVNGNFEQHSADPNSFRTSGSFLARFTGTNDQTVAINNYSGFGNSRFTHLEDAKPSGTLTFATYVAVAGDFTVSQSRSVVGSTVDVAGQITAVAGSDLSQIGNLRVVGGGTNFPVVAGNPAALLTIVSGPTVMLPADRTYAGPVNVDGVLDINGRALALGSNLRVGGAIIMKSPTGRLAVGGNVNFTGWSEDGNLIDGVLEVKGNFEQHSADPNSFRTGGSFTTRFTGTADQTVAINNYSGFGNSRFTHVEVAKPSGTLHVGSYIAVAGNFRVTSVTTVDGQPFDVADTLSTVAGSDLGTMSYVSIVGSGTFFPRIAGRGPHQIWLNGPIQMTSDDSLLTDLVITNTLTIGGHRLILGGNLTVQGALVMTSAADSVVIRRSANFTGWSEDGNLTAGVLDIKGNFDQYAADPNSFRATGTHLTRFSGTALQTVGIHSYSGIGNSRFQELEIAPAAQVTFSTPVTVAGRITLRAGSSATATNGLSHNGCTNAGGTVTGFSCP